MSEKADAEERSKNQSIELEKAAGWIRDLESQLVSIYKKILIHFMLKVFHFVHTRPMHKCTGFMQIDICQNKM